MRRIVAIILLGGVFTHLFYSSGFLIDYYVNSENYVELCENKGRPLLNCDGKCILAQKIAAAQEERNAADEATTPPIPFVNFQYLVSSFAVSFNSPESTISHQGFWVNPYLKNLVFILFKPPI